MHCLFVTHHRVMHQDASDSILQQLEELHESCCANKIPWRDLSPLLIIITHTDLKHATAFFTSDETCWLAEWIRWRLPRTRAGRGWHTRVWVLFLEVSWNPKESSTTVRCALVAYFSCHSNELAERQWQCRSQHATVIIISVQRITSYIDSFPQLPPFSIHYSEMKNSLNVQHITATQNDR